MGKSELAQHLNRSDLGLQKRLFGVPKLEDANLAGTKEGHSCTLILTEGDSAKALAVAGLSVVGRDRFGVFPLRGKLRNVRELSVKQMLENKEIDQVLKILALDANKEYRDAKGLRYGSIMIMTDQDHDGSHIKGLIINFIQHWFPSLLRMPGFLKEFVTPIVKVSKGDQSKTFFTLPEYEAWKEANNNGQGWKVKYYKGLGTSTSAEAREYFADIDDHEIRFTYSGNRDDDLIDMAFAAKRSDERKTWISQVEDGTFVDHSQPTLSYTDFIEKELSLFAKYDVERAVPSMVDGLKPGQRKVLFGCFKKKLSSEIKVAQLSGYVAENSAYHHGEASLQGTIIGMAQTFVGSNNINLLEPRGQFGSRLQGGKDHAASRYIFTCLSKATRCIFPEEDDAVLEYQSEEGHQIEPRFYCPIIPLALVNGADGIGTGWSTSIPNYNPRDLIANVRLILRRQEPVAMTPWYRGFKGAVRPVENFPGKFEAMGVAQQKGRVRLEITELPVKRWTQDYKEWLVEQLPKSGNERRASITEMREYHSENSVHFSLSMTPDKLAEAERRGFEKTFHLRSTTNPMAPPVLLVVGAAGAGKSSLVHSYVNTFDWQSIHFNSLRYAGEPAPRPSVGIESGMFYSLQPEEAETSDLRRAVPLGGVGFEIMEIGGREPVHRAQEANQPGESGMFQGEIPRGRDVCGLMVCYDSRDRTSFFRLWHVLCRHRMDRHMELLGRASGERHLSCPTAGYIDPANGGSWHWNPITRSRRSNVVLSVGFFGGAEEQALRDCRWSGSKSEVLGAGRTRKNQLFVNDTQAAQRSLCLAWPRVGDRVMVTKECWLGLILSGRKTIELRRRSCERGSVWLAHNGRVKGRAYVADVFVMNSESFERLRPQHCWQGQQPYSPVTYGLRLESIELCLQDIPYWAIGWNVFRESPADLPPKKLKYGLAALALLATLAVIGAGHRSEPSVAELKAQVQDWEQIPGIDEVVEHAKGLELQTPRHLEDLFYGSQPTELPWIRTECTIDVVQATAYLGQAVVFLYKSIDYPGLRCPDDSPAGCAASVAGFITSITWIASYLSFAANACGQSVRPAALCAGDWTALMANFGEMATVGAAVKEDCDFGKDWKSILDLEKEPETIPHEYWLHFEPKIDSEHRDTLLKWKGFQTAHRNRNFDVAQCVFDVTNSASYIVRAILQIRSAALACPEPRACAINIMNIISSFAWISQFTALAVSDCSKYGSQNALCAADISDMVAAVTNGPAAGVASTSDCADLPDPEDELHHLPMA
ncbi:unnamed protein product [Effrenium voratum]|nr:unnamed protein product [Effrenium voratum]